MDELGNKLIRELTQEISARKKEILVEQEIKKAKAATNIKGHSVPVKKLIAAFTFITVMFMLFLTLSTEVVSDQRDEISGLKIEIQELKVGYDNPLAIFHEDDMCEDGLTMTWRDIPVCGFI